MRWYHGRKGWGRDKPSWLHSLTTRLDKSGFILYPFTSICSAGFSTNIRLKLQSSWIYFRKKEKHSRWQFYAFKEKRLRRVCKGASGPAFLWEGKSDTCVWRAGLVEPCVTGSGWEWGCSHSQPPGYKFELSTEGCDVFLLQKSNLTPSKIFLLSWTLYFLKCFTLQ